MINIVGAFFVFMLAMGVLLPFYGLYCWYADRKQFKQDRNPYRRHCRKCGQRQEQMTRSYNNRITWWEDMGHIPNPKCSCHKYAEYHS